jgi:hypothetical protein
MRSHGVQQHVVNSALSGSVASGEPRASLSRLSAACLFVGHHRVDLHRDRDLAAPQDLHSNARVHVERRKQQAAGAAGVMDTDTPDASLGATQIEAATNCAWLDRSAGAGGEHQEADIQED